jgi:hypothetical protein
MEEMLEVGARLDAAHPSGPVRNRYWHPPVAPGVLDQALVRLAPLQPPHELIHLLLHGGWWPGELRSPETEGYFEQAVRYSSDPPPQIRWMSFASTWERDLCFVPLLDHSVPSAPLGLWSTQLLSVSVPAPSLAQLLTAFEVALEVLEHDDGAIEDPTWIDLITAPPPADHTVGAAARNRQVLLHERLLQLAATWTSDHPCWVPEEMPMAWANEPSPTVVNALLGTGS